MVFVLPSMLPTTILLLPPCIVKSWPIATDLFEPVICELSPAIIVANSAFSIDEVFEFWIVEFTTDDLTVLLVTVAVINEAYYRFK